MEDFIQGLRIAPPDERARSRARERWDQIAKPPGSLGLLEEVVERIAALTGDANVDLSRRCVVVLCADNGVADHGVSTSDASVTSVIAGLAAQNLASVCRMCEPAAIDCVPVDMGLREPVDDPCMLDRRIAAGTADIARGPAMTRVQALQAIRAGYDLAGTLAQKGYRLIATGEMGIGNTTTSTAMACALTGADPVELTGPGTGLTPAGVRHKAEVVRRALAANEPDASDALDVLAKLGGFDIAAMCGVFLGGAVHRVPVVVDGFISATAAYCAWRMRPECAGALLASHLSPEPAARLLLDAMGLEPLIHANMRLGEGTGAVCLVPLLDMALSLYRTGPTLADCGIVLDGGGAS